MNLKIINNVAIVVCRRTNSFDILDDMKSEMTLALLEDKIKNTIESLTSFAWKYYRKEISNRRVFMDMDMFCPEDYEVPHNNDCIRNKLKYNPAIVDSVYLLRAKVMTFSEIGNKLGISSTWALYQINNTIHLPIVSTKLKNRALEVTKIIIKERNRSNPALFKNRGKNINAKLNDQKVLKMRQLYGVDGICIAKIAQMPEFNVSRTVAAYAINGKTWKHVEPITNLTPSIAGHRVES